MVALPNDPTVDEGPFCACPCAFDGVVVTPNEKEGADPDEGGAAVLVLEGGAAVWIEKGLLDEIDGVGKEI